MNTLCLVVLVLVATNFLIVEGQMPPNILPQSCAEAVRPWKNLEGVYKMEIQESGLGPYYAYCINDPDGGPAWTVIQRRMDGSVNFFRKWDAYVAGFGDKNGEYWLGFNHTYRILNSTSYELWIKLIDFDKTVLHAKYGQFRVGNEAAQFDLFVANFSGNANDSLSYHIGPKFSAVNRDNDNESSENLAELMGGGWWMNCRSHFKSQLNGRYCLTGNKGGIAWERHSGHFGHYRYAHMAIRPKLFSANFPRKVGIDPNLPTTTEIPHING